MRMIALTLLFISNVCFAKSTLVVGANSSDNFSADVATDNPMQVVIKNAQTQKSQTISFKSTVSDIKKLTIKKTDSKKSTELLLVVLTVFDKEQTVLVMNLDNNNTSLCSLRNEGDFSWVDDQDLLGRVRLMAKNQKEQLQIKIGNRKTGSTKFSWVNCGTI